MISLFLVIHGVQLINRAGKQDLRRDDAPMFEFEKTGTLVTAGVYRYIRHPLYSSLLFMTWGVFFNCLTVSPLLGSVPAKKSLRQ